MRLLNLNYSHIKHHTMKKNLLYAVALAASLMGCGQPQDKNTEIENKVETLLHKMTLEEKIRSDEPAQSMGFLKTWPSVYAKEK